MTDIVPAQSKGSPMSSLIFISHSSTDQKLAAKLIQAIQASIDLPKSNVRCSSLAGHNLRAGSAVAEELRTDITECGAFIAILTPVSLSSVFVQLEIGARWGTGRKFFQIFAGGATPDQSNVWLQSSHGTKAETEDLKALLREIGRDVGREVSFGRETETALRGFVRLSRNGEAVFKQESGLPDPKERKSAEQKMLVEVANLFETHRQFWAVADEYFLNNFIKERSSQCPKSLNDLVATAGEPPGAATLDISDDLKIWVATDLGRLTVDQRLLWTFVEDIYPKKDSYKAGDITAWSAIKPACRAEEFHNARAILANFYDRWPPVVGERFILIALKSRYQYVLLLAWLELALVQWTQQLGPGKRNLQHLAGSFGKQMRRESSSPLP